MMNCSNHKVITFSAVLRLFLVKVREISGYLDDHSFVTTLIVIFSQLVFKTIRFLISNTLGL